MTNDFIHRLAVRLWAIEDVEAVSSLRVERPADDLAGEMTWLQDVSHGIDEHSDAARPLV